MKQITVVLNKTMMNLTVAGNGQSNIKLGIRIVNGRWIKYTQYEESEIYLIFNECLLP